MVSCLWCVVPNESTPIPIQLLKTTLVVQGFGRLQSAQARAVWQAPCPAGRQGGKGTGGPVVISLVHDNLNEQLNPRATGDFEPWNLPDRKRDFIVTLGFALQRANAKMVRDADLRRRRNRAGERYASSADQPSDSE